MKIKLWNRIEIKGTFDTYEIEQGLIEDRPDYFVTTSLNGYCNYDMGGHRSLIAAIQHVQQMIRNEYRDRCLDKPE